MSNEINLAKVEQEYGADQIQVLEGLEAVRRRPGMYIGSTSSAGLHHLVYEIVDNAIDEALAGYCDKITVEILPDNIIRVSDNGRGIPVGIHPTYNIPAVTMVFTKLHAGGKFGGGGYSVSGGLHGVGASVVNALSEWLEVEVHNGQNIYTQKFSRGDEVTELIKGEATETKGSIVTFKADAEIFEETEYDFNVLLNRLREQAFLNAGVHITFIDGREDEEQVVELCYEGGIGSFVEHIHQRRGLEALTEVIRMTGTINDVMTEVAMQYNDSYNENILSFANNIRTGDGGTHEVGFKTALTRVINDYAKKQNYLKEGNKNFSGEDVREGLTVIISVRLSEAQFEGQTKGKLGNSKARTAVDSLVSEKLARYLEEHPTEARAIVEKAMTASKAREAAKNARELTRKKNAMENSTLPGKLADCSEHDKTKTEIFIVEGDSAAGSAKGGRDRKYQAILPLWGKMLNVEKARIDKVYNNEKLMPVVTALGCSIGEDLDLEKLRYGKIILMADADVDGSHIRTLLLTFLFRYMKPLVANGHIYIAQPPLFKVARGKHVKYAFREEDLENTIKEVAPNGEKVDIQRYKGLGEMNATQLWETTMDPDTRTILQVTMNDAMKADEIFTILMGDKVGPRRDFIEQNARYVKNLDI